jgi:type I restriction enzyme S subunit
MNGKQLKNSILQWAIQGKLVPQDPNDEPASVLLDRIRAEKARLVKEGKIKKDKNESIIFRGDDNSHYEKFADGSVRCIDEEIPFEIPNSWMWVRIKQVLQINPKNKAEDYTEAAFIPMELIDATFFSSFSFVTRKWKEIKNGFTHFADGDIVFAKITPCFQNRKSMVLHDLPSGIGAGTTELKVLRPYAKTINEFYLLFFLESSYFVEQAVFKGTANQQRIVSGYLENKLFPLPPANEQKRIVESLKTLLTLADKYGKSQNALNSLNEELPKRIKQSILQEAIQGRLVMQDPNDEPATELLERIRKEKERLVVEGKLKRKDIADSLIFRGDDNKYYEQIGGKCLEISDEIPFDIPKSWSWCRLSQCCVRIFSGKSPSYSKTPTKHIIIGQQANQWEQIEMQYAKFGTEDYAKNIDEYQYLLDGDVLLNTLGNGTLGRCGIFENISGRVLTDGHLFVFRTIEKLLSRYILYYLTLNYTEINRKADGTTNQTFLNLKKVSNYLIPLPPLNEIKRIVATKEELYSKL